MKRYSGKLLHPLGKKISHIPANYITLCSLFSCIFVTIGYYFNNLGIAICFLFFIEFFDQLDGIVARIQGPTKFGAFLDSTLDRYGDAVLFIGLLLGNYSPSLFILLGLMGAFFTSYTRARVEGLGIKSLGGVGLFERTDRIPFLFLGTVIQFWIPQALFWTIILLIIGSHLTAIQRIVYAYRHLSHEKAPVTS